jgi:predicted flavoprotein YhiN
MKESSVEVRLDFMPDKPREKFESWLIKEISSRRQIQISQFLSQFFAEAVIRAIGLESRIKLDKSIAHITTLERKSLVHAIKDFRLTIKSHKPFNNTRGVIGGVSTDEIDPKSCESKLVKSLYFAGDIIDVLGPYGGYNMQFAFSSGYVAGRAAANGLV